MVLEGNGRVEYLSRAAREFIRTYREVRGKLEYVPERKIENCVTDPFCIAKSMAVGVEQVYSVLTGWGLANYGGPEAAAGIEKIMRAMRDEVNAAEYGPNYSSNSIPLSAPSGASGSSGIVKERSKPALGAKK